MLAFQPSAAACAAQARARDASPDTARLPGGGDMMGLGGDDSFAAAKARRETLLCSALWLPTEELTLQLLCMLQLFAQDHFKHVAGK